ncbi:MAG: Gfo/Idh/MocA family oxidoreductase, partial [Armatimonadota bacterium]
DWGDDAITVATEMEPLSPTMTIPLLDDARQKYYQNIAAHLMEDEELAVKPEEAGRAIGVMEAAERSAKSGRPEKVGI